MDIDCSFHINQYKTDDICLITAPRFYFVPDIFDWDLTCVGEHIRRMLCGSGKKYIVLYMYHTEDGNNDEHVNKVLDFMKNNGESSDEPVITFAQCVSCNRIATLGQLFDNFNFIPFYLGDVSKKCYDCICT